MCVHANCDIIASSLQTPRDEEAGNTTVLPASVISYNRRVFKPRVFFEEIVMTPFEKFIIDLAALISALTPADQSACAPQLAAMMNDVYLIAYPSTPPPPPPPPGLVPAARPR